MIRGLHHPKVYNTQRIGSVSLVWDLYMRDFHSDWGFILIISDWVDVDTAVVEDKQKAYFKNIQ